MLTTASCARYLLRAARFISGGLSLITSETVGWVLMRLAEVQGTLDVVANRPLLVRGDAEAKEMLSEAETKIGAIKERIRSEDMSDLFGNGKDNFIQ